MGDGPVGVIHAHKASAQSEKPTLRDHLLADGWGGSKLWRDRKTDRWESSLCKKLELNTKSHFIYPDWQKGFSVLRLGTIEVSGWPSDGPKPPASVRPCGSACQETREWSGNPGFRISDTSPNSFADIGICRKSPALWLDYFLWRVVAFVS
jgi:hypothetical protein